MKVFTVGAVVSLESGGPLMTVAREVERDRYECLWFDNDADLHCEIFNVGVLKTPSQSISFELRKHLDANIPYWSRGW